MKSPGQCLGVRTVVEVDVPLMPCACSEVPVHEHPEDGGVLLPQTALWDCLELWEAAELWVVSGTW
jgi:hypothetical protein